MSISLPLVGSQAFAVSSDDERKISVIEKKQFFKTYNEEPLDKRLARLEKRFFGDASSGSLDERVAKVFEAAGPVTDTPETTPAPVSSPVVPQVSAPNTAPKTSGNQPQYPSGPKDSEMEWEKAAMAAVGARDQEIRTLMKDAIRLSKHKETDAALEKFGQVIRLDPRNAEAHFSLGVIYEAKGQLDEALSEYNLACDINPDRMDFKAAITSLEEKANKKGDFDKKQEEMNRLAQEAAAAFKRRELMTALELYKRLETDFPKNASYKYNIGTIYLMMNNQVQAYEYYEMARKLNPKEERYVAACAKLKDTLKTEDAKTKESDSLWDKKEKGDRKKEKEEQKRQAEILEQQMKARGMKPVKGGKQQAQRLPQGTQAKAPRSQMPPQMMPPGFNQPGLSQMQPGYQSTPNPGYGNQTQMQPNFQQQMPPGFQQQAPRNQMPMQPGVQQQMPQPYQQQQQQPGFQQQQPPPGYGNQQPMQNFNPQQQQFNNQMMQQPGFNQRQMQPNFNNQMPNYNQQFNQQFSPSGQMPPQSMTPQGQPGLSGLTQPGFNSMPGGSGSGTPSTPVNPANVLSSLGLLVQSDPKGVTITTIGIGSRAAKAGLSRGDVIVAVDGVEVSTMAQLTSLLTRKVSGETAQLMINRKGKVGNVVL